MKKTQKTLNKRAVVSILLFVSLMMMPISAILIHMTHGFSISHLWLHVHVLFGILFTICGILHIVNNWRALKRYVISH